VDPNHQKSKDPTTAMNPILEDFCIFDDFGQVIKIKRHRKKVWI
jgi:hypothetical protein